MYRPKLFTRVFPVILSLLFLNKSSQSQTLVGSTGNTITDNSVFFEYAIGEIAITTLNSSSNAITQGLLQPMFSIEDCKIAEYVATAFTPNKDGLNDCFGVTHWPLADDFQLSIYNRWGERIFHTTDLSNCWDGTFKGKEQGAGVYVYMIFATTSCGPTFKKGTFVLIR